MQVIEHTATRLVFQEEKPKGCIPKGALVNIEALPYALIGIGAILLFIAVGGVINQRTESASDVETDVVFMLIGIVCLFIAWRNLTDDLMLATEIFDLEAGLLTIRAKRRHTHDKSVFELADFQHVKLEKPSGVGGCYSVTLVSKQRWGYQLISSSVEIGLETPKLIADFLHIPFVEIEHAVKYNFKR